MDDARFDAVAPTVEALAAPGAKEFPVIDDAAGERMRAEIARAREEEDSVGGVIECAAIGVPAGVGDPMFDGVENCVARALFGIPAVKGVEFGAGFAAADVRGSQNNDPFCVRDGKVACATNNAGGILGGITDGMPLVVRCAVKPTPSIGRPQRSVDVRTMEECELVVRGRHDPCIVPRAVPVVEATVALALLDLWMDAGLPAPAHD